MTDVPAAEEPARLLRRWPWVVIGAFLVVAALAAVFWYLFVPNWRPSLRSGELYGVDVSSHQGEIDWRAVVSDKITYAHIKASEGGDFTDERFVENWTAAKEAGLERGAYHFFTLCRTGREQAEHFLAVAAPDPDALPPAVDLELAGNCGRRPSRAEVDAEVGAFLEVVERAWDRRAVIYVRDDWESRYPVREKLDRPLWHFRFLRRPNLDNWVIWQINGFAHVNGISGGVDLNLMRSTEDR